MKEQSIFQIVVLAVFVVLFILGFLGFSDKIPLPKGKGDVNYGEITFWGTLPAQTMNGVIEGKLRNDKSIAITYVQKDKATISRELVEALARGEGPDIFMLSEDEILKNLDKVTLIPYETYSERAFKDAFIEEGELYLSSHGIAALPFIVDPLIMYWNRDIFTSAGIVTPPQRWSQFYAMTPKIVKKDENKNITRSFVSFGEYQNVSHAKDILSTLIMQAGNAIILRKDGTLSADIFMNSGSQTPSASAVSFYTEFSRQEKDSYSWNRSLPVSRSMFEAGDLAVYFGFASEYRGIRERNPHLNFDVGVIPQADQTATKVTFAHMQAIAIPKAAKNPNGALYGAFILTTPEVIGSVVVATGLPPVRRDLLSIRQSDAVYSVFYESAVISRAWLDPSRDDTNVLFQRMINDVGTGQRKISEALTILQNSMTKLLINYQTAL